MYTVYVLQSFTLNNIKLTYKAVRNDNFRIIAFTFY